jgi:hypothetical protein
MMTEQLRVSIVAAPLAAIDSRALSQAWYSALHLARAQTPGPQPARTRSPRLPEATVGVPSGTLRRRVVEPPNPLPRARFAEAPRAACGDAERKRAHASFARRIEAALMRPSHRPARAAFVVGEGAARAFVVLQTRAGKTHLVAICAPAHRDAVARALAQVRRSLAARGIPCESRVEASA